MNYKFWIVYAMIAMMMTVLGWVIAAHAQDPSVRRGQVNVTSSSQGVLITDRILMSLRVGVPSTAAAPVCFAFVNPGTACSTITSAAAALCVPAGKGYEWPLRIYGYSGSLCAILESGSTTVTCSWSDP